MKLGFVVVMAALCGMLSLAQAGCQVYCDSYSCQQLTGFGLTPALSCDCAGHFTCNPSASGYYGANTPSPTAAGTTYSTTPSPTWATQCASACQGSRCADLELAFSSGAGTLAREQCNSCTTSATCNPRAPDYLDLSAGCFTESTICLRFIR